MRRYVWKLENLHNPVSQKKLIGTLEDTTMAVFLELGPEFSFSAEDTLIFNPIVSH